MAYDKTKTKAVGDALYDLIEAVTDGVGLDDMDEMMALAMRLKDAQNELATDTDASVLHVASALTDRLGDARVNPDTP